MTDKWLHLLGSYLIASLSPGLAILAGVGKELWDAFSGGVADAGDLVADALGIMLALVFG